MKNQYLIVGSGRVARHFAEYLRLLQQPLITWSRKHNDVSDFERKAAQASHILLCISDSALPGFVQSYPFLSNKVLVHFSGALEIPGLIGVHPLMTFGPELYSLETYEAIPFIVTSSLNLPGISNPTFQISSQDKAYYHALCVMGGNFATLLWSEMRQGLQSLGLPPEVANPYLRQLTRNFLTNPDSALTGPLARKDLATIQKNLEALHEHKDSYEKIYRAFTDIYLGRDL